MDNYKQENKKLSSQENFSQFSQKIPKLSANEHHTIRKTVFELVGNLSRTLRSFQSQTTKLQRIRTIFTSDVRFKKIALDSFPSTFILIIFEMEVLAKLSHGRTSLKTVIDCFARTKPFPSNLSNLSTIFTRVYTSHIFHRHVVAKFNGAFCS